MAIKTEIERNKRCKTPIRSVPKKHPPRRPIKVSNQLLLEIRVSQNLAKLGVGRAHKMSGMEGGENWNKLCSLGERVSTLVLILDGEM